MKEQGDARRYSESEARSIIEHAVRLDEELGAGITRNNLTEALREIGVTEWAVERAIAEHESASISGRVPSIRVKSGMFLLGTTIGGLSSILAQFGGDYPLVGGPWTLALGTVTMIAAIRNVRRGGLGKFWVSHTGLWTGFALLHVIAGLLNGEILFDPEYGAAILFSAGIRWLLSGMLGSIVLRVGRIGTGKSDVETFETQPSWKQRLGDRLKSVIDHILKFTLGKLNWQPDTQTTAV